MSTYFGLNTDTASSLFTSYSNSSSNSTSGNSLYDSLGEYSLIKGGTYYKLCKSYYTQEDSGTSSSTTQDKNDTVTADNAVSLKKASKTLSDTDFAEDNRDEVVSNVKSFVNAYNDLVSSSSDSETNSVAECSSLLSSFTKANQTLLSQVGITIGSDSTLSVDETKMATASLTDLKTLFSGSGSFNSQVSSYATSIYSGAMMNSSSYNSSGSISTLNLSSLYNSYA